MRPTEVAARDWNLYYNRTIMHHSGFGVVQVNVADSHLYVRKDDTEDWRRSDAAALSCLWPRAGAVNWMNRGIYVARRSRRESRRSASLNHYYIAWSGNIDMGREVTHNLLAYLCFPNEHPSIDFAYDALSSRSRDSVAISHELILGQALEGCSVMYKADMAGTLVRSTEPTDNASYVFQPSLESSPAAKRAAFKLQKEGILCP